MASVDVVIVAYRSAKLLPACLDSVLADRITADPADPADATNPGHVHDSEAGSPSVAAIVVVDNASPDGSADVAAHHRAAPTVLVNSENLGFGAACNRGAAAVSAPYVLFLNPDARIAPGTVAGLTRELERESTLGAVGPALADPAGRYRAAAAGYEPGLASVAGHFLLLGRLPGVGRRFRPLQLPAASTDPRPDWVSGAAMLVRRTAFEEVGGFDATMFLYMEDVDLCRRLREHGWGIAYSPGFVVWHELGGTQGAEQSPRWASAFHAYVRRRHGAGYARACSAIAALGLAARAVAYLPGRRPLAMRLARAARAFATAALGASTPAMVVE